MPNESLHADQVGAVVFRCTLQHIFIYHYKHFGFTHPAGELKRSRRAIGPANYQHPAEADGRPPLIRGAMIHK